MEIKKRVFKLLFCCLLFHVKLTAQTMGTPTDADFTTANPGLFNNNDYFSLKNSEGTDIISKDLYTGIASVNIPLFKNVINGINFGVSLSYNTGGIVVDRISSEIGLGWEINYGPSITRQVRDIPDETRINCVYNEYNVLWNDMPEYIFGKFYLLDSRKDGFACGYWYAPASYNVADMEPDIFYLNLNGKMIRFMYSSSGDLLTIPESNVQIIRYLQGSPITGNTIPTYPAGSLSHYDYDGSLAFEVIDEGGNQYYFQGVHQTLDYALTTDAWMPSKIITYDNHKINYVYNTASARSETNSVAETVEALADGSNTVIYSAALVGNGYQYQQLAAIDYDNGVSVNFDYSTANRCDLGSPYLSDIRISEIPPSGVSPRSYSYRFNQAYFVSPTAMNPIVNEGDDEAATETPITHSCGGHDSTTTRLKLKSIDKIGFDNTTVQRYYTFNYLATPLPERIFGGRDAYGYSNGAIPQRILDSPNVCIRDLAIGEIEASMTNYGFYANSALLIPYLYVNTFTTSTDVTGIPTTITYGMNRSISSSRDVIGAFSLESITNQNGGYTYFTYDATANVAVQPLPGIAIVKITEHDGYNYKTDKNFIYNYYNATRFPPFEGGFDVGSRTENNWSNCASGDASYTWNVHTNQAAFLNTGWGPRFGFGQITESVYDFVYANLLGSTQYYYDINGFNYESACTSNVYPAPGYPYTNKQCIFDWYIHLNHVISYDMNANPISETYYNYSDNFLSYGPSCAYGPDKFGGKHQVTIYQTSGTPWVADHNTIDTYYPVTGRSLLTNKVENKYYANGNYISKTTNYAYDNTPAYTSFNHNFPMNNLVKEWYVNSKGETIAKNYYYNYAWASSTVGAINAWNSNNVQQLIYTDTWKQDLSGTNNLIGLNASGFSAISSTGGTTIYKPNTAYSLATSINAPITTSGYVADIADMSSASNSITGMQLKSSVTKFDLMGDAIEITDKTSNQYNSFIYDENTGSLLAEAVNAKNTEIAYCGFESNYLYPSTYITGNWTFCNGCISTVHALLGRASYNCSMGVGITGNASTMSLITGKQYTVSFWTYGGALSAVNAGTAVSLTVAGTYTVPLTGEVWTLYKGNFTAAGPVVNITQTVGGAVYADEVKVYPSNSLMETHNYLPLTGKTADVDANDNITTYEYDVLGNKTVTRDQNGNILSQTKTVTQGN